MIPVEDWRHANELKTLWWNGQNCRSKANMGKSAAPGDSGGEPEISGGAENVPAAGPAVAGICAESCSSAKICDPIRFSRWN